MRRGSYAMNSFLPPTASILSSLTLIVFAFVRLSAAQPACPDPTVAQIQECVVPVVQEAERLGLGIQGASRNGQSSMLPKIGKQVFLELCKLIDEFDRCLGRFNARLRCPNHITLRLIDASYGFLCKDGRDVFLQNADCLMQLDQESSVKQCHDVTMQRIKEANAKMQNFEEKTGEMCRALDAFTHCVQNPVIVNCGEEAWSVIVRVLRDTTRTLMPTCRLSPDIIVPPGRIPFATTTFSNNLVRDDANPRTQRPPLIYDWNTKDPYEGNRVQIAEYNRVYPTQNSNGIIPGTYYDNQNTFGQAARDSGGSRSRTRNGAEKSRFCLNSGGILFFSLLTLFFTRLLIFWN